MSDWTPGPLTVHAARILVGGERDFAIADSENCIIAEAFGRVSETGVRPARANAELFAAAPRLYAALEQLLGWYDAPPLDLARADLEVEAERQGKIVDEARAALAAARGEES